MRVVFSDRAYTAVLAETLSKINTETGGVFLGKIIENVWYIVESIDPGPKSIFEVDYFEYDQQYVQHLINKIALLYDERLELIGLWHRHPGSFDVFSRTDDGTNTQYAAIRQQGAISMLVNLEPEFRFTIYHVAQPCVYLKLHKYEVGDELFPKGLLGYKNPEVLLERLNRKARNNIVKYKAESLPRKNLDEVLNIILPELIEKYSYDSKLELFNGRKENFSKKIAESVASDVMYLSDRYGIQFYPTSLPNKLIIAQGSGEERIEMIFTYNKKEDTLIFTYLENTFYYREGLFERLIRKVINDGV